MELLMANQPWNLVLFMVVPVVLAETLAITEFFILLRRPQGGALRAANRVAGLIAGPYFVVVFVYLLISAVAPLTADGGWRGPFDVIAVGFYLLGVVPYAAISLIELRVICRSASEEGRLKAHAAFVALFLIVAHVAMIFGMLDPGLLDFGAAAPDAAGALGGSSQMSM
jgi:hypothetical protein